MVDLDSTFAYSRIVAIKLYDATAIVYPNPASETVRIDQSLLPVIKSPKILDANGIVLYEAQNPASPQVNIKGFQSGTYLIIFTHKDGSLHTHKLVVAK
ncbi:T9SS type A sorting domain-containing protein [Dyadobacter sp. BHUBP1]|uniref:T9SS type A sorting domain-containing protein n=1 Tax=Dyadobacter sp. BHUBP1 TaxID=3424178 RepID=UPI003D34D205